jgi:DNA-directed RNA polymerase specialized sigma subunit
MAKQPKKFQNSHDPTFTIFAQEVAKGIEQNTLEDKGQSQRQRFEELVSAERLFHETLLSYRIHREIYKKFIQLIRVVNNNILSARPYFRETSETFSTMITPALKARDPDALTPFAVNFHFIKFCKDNYIGLWPKKLEILYKRIELARTILIRANLPLAINRAKIFFRKVPKGQISFTDMIQMAAIGLSQGVDKYTGEFKPNFVGVCIGRITGGLIDMYSETPMHFYPGDRRVLYRANSIRGRQGITDISELTQAVNDSFTADLAEGKTAPKQTTVTELSYLLSAASLVSADSNDGEDGFGVYDFTADSTENAEEILGRKQQISNMVRLARKLPLINQKVLRLKGIEI